MNSIIIIIIILTICVFISSQSEKFRSCFRRNGRLICTNTPAIRYNRVVRTPIRRSNIIGSRFRRSYRYRNYPTINTIKLHNMRGDLDELSAIVHEVFVKNDVSYTPDYDYYNFNMNNMTVNVDMTNNLKDALQDLEELGLNVDYYGNTIIVRGYRSHINIHVQN